jgi:hypothetical protein
MKKVLKIDYDNENNIRETTVEFGIAAETSQAHGRYSVQVHIPDSYFPKQERKYHLVLLTDDELNELEKKAKEGTTKKTRHGGKMTYAEERLCELVCLQGAK